MSLLKQLKVVRQTEELTNRCFEPNQSPGIIGVGAMVLVGNTAGNGKKDNYAYNS